MKRFFQRIAILLVVTLLAPTLFSFIPSLDGLTSAQVSAKAAKAEIGSKEITVGIAGSPEYIFIKNMRDDAVYTYTSANKKIATVNEYGIIKGVAKGKTTIMVKETLNKKTTEVGKITVNVVGPKLHAKKMDVGIESGTYVQIDYMNWNAEYTYKSSDSKTVKVDQYGYITGVKYGKATVTVTEKYKGKSTKVGTITVNVVNGKLADKEITIPVSSYSSASVIIDCYNPKATYSYKSANSKIAKVSKSGEITGVKKGTTTIAVTETYNKKTVKLGSLTVKVVGASIDSSTKNIEIGINSTYYLTNVIYLKYANWDAVYTCKSSDESIVWAGQDADGYGYQIKGVGLGTATLTVYEEYKGEKSKVGTVKVTVKEIPVTDFSFNTYWLDEVDGKYVATFYMDDYWSRNLYDYYYKYPYEATTPVTYASSDETVATVSEDGTLNLVGAGEAEITITCGKFSFKFTVIVKASDTDSEDMDTSEGWEDDFE